MHGGSYLSSSKTFVLRFAKDMLLIALLYDPFNKLAETLRELDAICKNIFPFLKKHTRSLKLLISKSYYFETGGRMVGKIPSVV